MDLDASVTKLTAPRVFTQDIAIVGAGVYIRPEARAKVQGSISWVQDGEPAHHALALAKLPSGVWHKFGGVHEVPISSAPAHFHDVRFALAIETPAPIGVFGIVIGALGQEHLVQHDVSDAFRTKTSLYIPEILFLDPIEDALSPRILHGSQTSPGEVVCKSCNRCSRFLPIDIDNERNTISFSNHCITRAPCAHSAFARYRIDAGSPATIANHVRDGAVETHYGYQLECRACKKFFVNLPLNPMRDSTQHREDSLRRRALEVLVAELLGRDWIYHEHRMATGREFDVDIWKRFGGHCFKCGVNLPTPSDMDLDHTLPLAYLWPLDNTATCLCPSCNSAKRDKFPADFYNPEQLEKLSRVTGIPLEALRTRPINEQAVEPLIARIDWFFDTFLAEDDYQKVRAGKRTADLILHALQSVLRAAGNKLDLVERYRQTTGRLPTTVSLG